MTIASVPLYDLTVHSLDSKPSVYSQGEEEYMGICETFQYNHSQIEEFYQTVKCKKWVLSVIHGFCKHISKNWVI